MRDLVTGVVLLALVATFWVQRDYRAAYGGVLPDTVMVLLAVMGLTLAVRGFLARRSVAEETEAGLPWRALLRAVGLLAAWVLSLPYLGYLVGGIVFFTLMALLMRTERLTWRGALLDLAVACAVVGAFYLLFTQVLYVRLPQLGG
jgi:hypothetical protein